MEACASILFVLLVPLFFAGVLGFILFNQKRSREAWANIATALGLEYSQGSFFGIGVIEGERQGYWVRVDTFSRGSGKNSKTYTRIQTFLNPTLNLGLAVYREHLFSGIGKMFGSQDIEVGDSAFDGRFMVKGNSSDAVLRLLSADLRKQLMLYDERVGPLNVDDDRLYYETRGMLTDQATIEHVLTGQQVVAQRLTRAFAQSSVEAAEPAYQHSRA